MLDGIQAGDKQVAVCVAVEVVGGGGRDVVCGGGRNPSECDQYDRTGDTTYQFTPTHEAPLPVEDWLKDGFNAIKIYFSYLLGSIFLTKKDLSFKLKSFLYFIHLILTLT